MKKKIYVKPQTMTMHMDCSQIMAASPQSIQKSDDPTEITPDDEGYYWAD